MHDSLTDKLIELLVILIGIAVAIYAIMQLGNISCPDAICHPCNSWLSAICNFFSGQGGGSLGIGGGGQPSSAAGSGANPDNPCTADFCSGTGTGVDN